MAETPTEISQGSPENRLGALIQQEIIQADGAEGNELRGHQEMALDYYFGRRPNVGEADESYAVSTDLRDMVTAVIAQLTPMIGHDALVSFEPRGAEDEDAARMEAKALNRVVMDQNSGYTKLQGALKDAALARNCFGKVWCEETEVIEIRQLRVPEETTASQVVAALNEDRNTVAELKKQLEDDIIEVKLTHSSRRFRWRAVDPRKFYYAQGWDEYDLQGIRFCAERMLKSRSDLIKEGYDRKMVEMLPKSTKEAEHTAVRAQDMDQTMLQDQPKTQDQELVDIYYAYINVDLDDDGVAERYAVVAADKRLVLEYEQVDYVPYFSGALMIRANRLQGEDLFDHLAQTQENKTAVLRRWLDNQRACTFGRLAVQEGNVDPKAEDARNGQFMYTQGPPAESIMAVPITDAGPSCEAALNYLDKQRTEAGGAALDMQTSGANVQGDTWRGINEQYTVKEMLASMFAKNLAETYIRGLYLLMHRLLRTQAVDPIGVRMRDQWVNVEPSRWPAREEITVLPGLTPRARMAQTQVLQTGLEFSMAGLQAGMGGQLIDAASIYKTVIDLYRCAGIETPEQYFVDPMSEKAKQNAERTEQQQQVMEQRKLEMLAAQLKSIELEHKVAARNKSIDARVDLFKAELDATVDLAKVSITEEGKADDRALTAAVERARSAVDKAGANGSSKGAGAQEGNNG